MANAPKPTSSLRNGAARVLLALGLVGCGTARADSQHVAGNGAPVVSDALPKRLSGTGLYAPGSTTELARDVLSYVPQYPLWSDGAAKHRFIALPAGTHVDASNADEW